MLSRNMYFDKNWLLQNAGDTEILTIIHVTSNCILKKRNNKPLSCDFDSSEQMLKGFRREVQEHVCLSCTYFIL